MLAQNKKMFCEVFRTIYTTSRVSANHYDVLGVTPKATQNDIKSAYYKLSKLYHPDKSKDEESAKKFRAITEAYEVLGNISLKKMYDKGLLVGRSSITRSEYKPEEEPTDPSLKFYKSRRDRNVVPTMDGRTPIYDFDAWSKQHYGDLLKKQQVKKQDVRHRKQRAVDSANQEMVIYSMFALGTLFMALIVYGTSDYDVVDDEIQKNNAKLQNGQNMESKSKS
ncbi:dnaJ homolog subfamily C member 30, mitochondrial [Bicyclus anynana]|uniref:DnaJ homolog subfamily C member 30, mitochondrial n=1 Tax=Bicyclus anynana TaxID=110368 RepID=A0A6J1N9M5_BICAN|nr:dnaJ homolog subfamily C member 30, mitochondrial [Bicyclus anynana]